MALHRVLNGTERRHDDDRQLGVEFLGRAKHAESITLRETEVRKHDAWPRRSEGLDGLSLVARFDDGMTLSFEGELEHRPQGVFVFDEENGRVGRAARGHYRSQPGGTFERRASSSKSEIAFLSASTCF